MNLNTRYLGLELKHPVVASASPLSADIDGIHSLLDAGAAAVVMASVFEEQVAANSGVLEEHLELHPGNEVPASAISISNLSAKSTLGRALPAALRRLLDEGGPELA